MKAYEEKLPEGYTLTEAVDLKPTKMQVILNLIAIVAMFAVLVPVVVILLPTLKTVGRISNWAFVGFIAGTIAYVFAHEGVHGLAGVILTHKKPKFGFGVGVSYCYFEGLYFYKWSALILALAPFVVFSAGFLIPAIVCTNVVIKFIFWWLFAMHFGGCVGDLYDAYLLLFKRNSPEVLMLDDGIVQRFYEKLDIKTEQPTQSKLADVKSELETQKGAEITIEKTTFNASKQ